MFHFQLTWLLPDLKSEIENSNDSNYSYLSRKLNLNYYNIKGKQMFVCVCHALSESDIELAEAHGAKSEKQVFGHFGLEAQCGRCIDSICGRLKCAKGSSDSGRASIESECDVGDGSHPP